MLLLFKAGPRCSWTTSRKSSVCLISRRSLPHLSRLVTKSFHYAEQDAEMQQCTRDTQETAYDWVKGILSTYSDKPAHIIAPLAAASLCGRIAWSSEKSPLCVFFPSPFFHWEVGRGQPSCSPCHRLRRRHTLDPIQLQADLTVAACHGRRQQHVDSDPLVSFILAELCFLSWRRTNYSLIFITLNHLLKGQQGQVI